MEEQYSEDYAHLVAYRQNITPETTEAEVTFFFNKYRKLIDRYCKRFLLDGMTTSLKHAHTDKVGFDERDGFTRDRSVLKHERSLFLLFIRHYVERAVSHFEPDKIETKASYCFASYLVLWLKTGTRDLIRKHRRHRLNVIRNSPQQNVEESVIEKIDAERTKQKLAVVMATLSPLDRLICTELSAGKKQNEIHITNEKTGGEYSLGYICKRVAAIRTVMEANGISL